MPLKTKTPKPVPDKKKKDKIQQPALTETTTEITTETTTKTTTETTAETATQAIAGTNTQIHAGLAEHLPGFANRAQANGQEAQVGVQKAPSWTLRSPTAIEEQVKAAGLSRVGVGLVTAEDAYLSQSEGDNFITAWDAWTSLAPADRVRIGKNESTVAAWLEEELGFEVNSSARYNQLLKDDGWNALAKRFCDHRFGREAFVISNFTKCMQHRIREFWESYFGSPYEQLEDIFGKGKICDIKQNELEMLASLGSPADNPEQLQVCFYPGEDDRPDQVNKLLKINPSWFSATEYREVKLNKAVTIGATKYKIRRPGLLSHLDEKSYKAVYTSLVQVTEPVFSPSHFRNEMKNGGLLLSILCRISIFMVHPSWKPPTGATPKELNNTDYIHVIAQTCLSLPLAKNVHNRRGATPQEMVEAAKKNISKACDYAVALRELLSETMPLWERPAALKSELTHLVNVSMSVDQICCFVDRFAYEPWASFFKLFEKHFGLERLTGCMAFFKEDPSLIDKLANTIRPLHQSFKSTYRLLLKDRFHDMPFMAKPSHLEAVARAADYAIVCTEYRLFDYYMDRYEKADQYKQDGADEEEIWEQGDGLSVEQYQLCQKHLADLARALQDYGTTVDPDERGQGAALPDFRVDEYRPNLSRTYDPTTYLPPPSAQAVATAPTKKRKKAPAPEGDEVGSDASPATKRSKAGGGGKTR